MKDIKIAPNNQLLMPYLIVKNAAGFLAYLEKVFDGKETFRHERPEEPGVIMHGEVMINEQATVMFAEASDAFGVQNAGMFIYVENCDESHARAIANGGKEIMPISNQEYGRTCGILDPYGNTWWITAL